MEHLKGLSMRRCIYMIICCRSSPVVPGPSSRVAPSVYPPSLRNASVGQSIKCCVSGLVITRVFLFFFSFFRGFWDCFLSGFLILQTFFLSIFQYKQDFNTIFIF